MRDGGSGLAPAIQVRTSPCDSARPQANRAGEFAIGNQTVDGRSAQARDSDHCGHAQEELRHGFSLQCQCIGSVGDHGWPRGCHDSNSRLWTRSGCCGIWDEFLRADRASKERLRPMSLSHWQKFGRVRKKISFTLTAKVWGIEPRAVRLDFLVSASVNLCVGR